MNSLSRREAAKLMAFGSLGISMMPSLMSFNTSSIMKRKIPSSGHYIPVIGLGTWQSFDVGNSSGDRARLIEVLKQMNSLGGRVIDSSPMYGSSETVVGDLTSEMNIRDEFFYATKVWTSGRSAGIDQMNSSFRKMRRQQMDLMQIHNLVDWRTHIKTLKEWKEIGKIKYWGITHYTNSSHNTLADIIRNERPDFAQFNYSINARNAENKLLDTAKKHGTAVIINRPYDGGSLFRLTRGKALPDWCAELDIHSWGQFFLKYIISHPAVTCVIPGTSKPHHVVDNMKAGYGKILDTSERKRLMVFVKTL
jgi:diketogulonate reductase-like aldo/keto reductase